METWQLGLFFEARREHVVYFENLAWEGSDKRQVGN